MKGIFFVFCALVVGMARVSGQDSTVYLFSHTGEAPIAFNPGTAGNDSVSLRRYLSDFRNRLVGDGYLAASFDTVKWFGDTARIHLYVGDKYEWAFLSPGNVPEETLNRNRFRDKLYHERPVDPVRVSKLMSGILDRMTATGYPFATIGLDSIRLDGSDLWATLHLEKNSFTTIDSLIIKGDFVTERNFVQSYLGLKKGMAYDDRLLRKIPSRIRELPFVEAIKPYEIGMREGKADVYLYLRQKKASHFDGILGVLPDEKTGEILLTGELTLNLMNALRRGETIGIQWQRLQTQTQELNIGFIYPFLFGTPLGTDLSFNLYRRDTLFTRTKFHGAADYYLLGNNKVSLFIERSASNVLSDEVLSSNLYANSEIFMVGLSADIRDLDYRFNPRKGYFVTTSFATGNKTTDGKDTGGDGPGAGSGKETDDIYNANINGGKYFGIGKRSTLLARVLGGLYINDNMFRNESYRIGGLKTLRGFDEQSIFATGYAVATVEFRFILEQNSNIFVFFDQGYYEDRLREQTLIDNPFGFGGGVNFETGAGIFSLTYALGKQFDNQISLKSGKIHFGFVSFF